MKRKFQHFLLFLLLLQCSWAYNIFGHADHKFYSKNDGVAAGNTPTIGIITPGSCTLFVHWTCSSCTNIDGYNVYWQMEGSQDTETHSVSANSDSYTIDGLNSDQSYTVWVASVSDEEESLSAKKDQTTSAGDPKEVTGVTAETVSDTIIKVSWKKTTNDCPIKGYRVTYTGTSKFDSLDDQGNRDTEDITLDVDYLAPYTDYDFQVSEVTTDGLIGNPSELASAATDEGPASAPKSVTSLTLGPSSVQVNWTIPEASNGVITNYHISCQLLPDTEDQCDVTVDDIDTFTYDVTNLEACGDYTFSVQAINGYEDGYGEAATDSSTTDDETPPSIGNFGYENLTSTSVILTWDPLATHCPVIQYDIHVDETVLWDGPKDDSFDRSSLKGENNYYELDGLIPYSLISVSITATTSGGLSDPTTQKFDTLEDVAGAPDTIGSSTVDTDTVSLTWGPSTAINGVLTGYKVCYRKTGTVVDHCPITTKANVLSTDVSGLDACGEYTFAVNAVNGAGDGDAATVKDSTENEQPPDIKNLKTGKEVTSTSVPISFEPPDTTCDILRYDVVGTGIPDWDNKTTIEYHTTLEGGNSTYVLEGLNPYTNYEFNMSATTAGGTTGGQQFETDTLKDVPSAPVAFVATTVDSSSVQLTWKEPQYQNGIALGNYHLTYELLGKESDAIVVKKGVNKYTLGDHLGETLLPCQTYTIRLRASNEKGFGDPATEKPKLGPEVPNAVRSLKCKTLGSRSIELTYRVQRSSCRTNYYHVSLLGDITWDGTTTNTTRDITHTISSMAETLTLDDLIPYTDYEITLEPGNDAGLGNPQSTGCQTFEDVPGKPTGLSVTDSTKSKLDFKWEAPDDKNGFLTRFKITLNDDEDNAHFVSADNDTSTYYYSFDDLDDDTYYKIKVYAENSKGFSNEAAETTPNTDNNHLGAILGTVIPVIVIIILIVAGVWYNKSSKKKKKNKAKANTDD